MKQIKLATKSKDEYAIVDDDVFVELSKRKWHSHSGYAYASIIGVRGRCIAMHHLILGTTPRRDTIDHINRNRLDNRKSNLRVCTYSQNNLNQKMMRNNTSGCIGVYFHKPSGKWRAEVNYQNKRMSAGYFKTREEAIVARAAKAQQVFGNFIQDVAES